MLKILFIGGTGRISASITELCLNLGHEVYLLNRGVRTSVPAGAVHLKGDISDEAHVADLISDHRFDTVTNFVNYNPSEVERDIRLFRSKTDQYIFISTASAYSRNNYRITESTPLYNPYWEYSRKKILCEDILTREYRATAFPITIVRPSHTYDKTAIPVPVHSGSPRPVVKRMLEGKPVIVPGDGTSLWVLTHSRDFAKGFVGLLGNPHAIGEAVHITSDEVLTWNQIMTQIARALGVAPNLCHVPTNKIIAANPDYEGPLWGDKARSAVFDNSKIKSLVPGFEATIRFDMGIRESVTHFLATPGLHKEDPSFDAFTDMLVQRYM